MRVAVVGTGYVGLVVGAALADFGQDVVCIDKDAQKIQLLRQKQWIIHEPGLPELATRGLEAGRLRFSTELGDAVRDSEVILIAVGTEALPDGHVNLTAVREVARQIGASMEQYTVVVMKSTVPVGTSEELTRLIRENQKQLIPFDVVSNPEFQREGSAVRDFIEPYRIVLGTESERALGIMRELYRPTLKAGVPLVVTTNRTAEMIKYAANAFLALRVSYVNELANLCERLDCDVLAVSRAMGLDPRIGPHYLLPGPGYGGSCLPKDTQALIRQAEALGMSMQLVEATVRVNEARPEQIVSKLKRHLGSLAGRRLAVLGLSFKDNTDDVRSSPAIRISEILQAEGARLRVHDPTANRNARHLLEERQTEFCSDPYDAAREADGVLILTEWDEFRTLDLQKLRSMTTGNLLFDARNILDPKRVVEAGFVYEGVGRLGRCAEGQAGPAAETTAKTSLSDRK